MNKFKIEIQETLQRVVEVEADSLEEALDQVDSMYQNEEIVLGEHDFKDYKIIEYVNK